MEVSCDKSKETSCDEGKDEGKYSGETSGSSEESHPESATARHELQMNSNNSTSLSSSYGQIWCTSINPTLHVLWGDRNCTGLRTKIGSFKNNAGCLLAIYVYGRVRPGNYCEIL